LTNRLCEPTKVTYFPDVLITEKPRWTFWKLDNLYWEWHYFSNWASTLHLDSVCRLFKEMQISKYRCLYRHGRR